MKHISGSLPQLPALMIDSLVNDGLTVKDAKTLVSLDAGQRLDYFDEVRESRPGLKGLSPSRQRELVRMIANWFVFLPLPISHVNLTQFSSRVLHELGGLLNSSQVEFSPDLVPAQSMADILLVLDMGLITGTTAKQILTMIFDGDVRGVETIINQENLQLQPLARKEYLAMAKSILCEYPEKVAQIRQDKQYGKIQFFVGQMMRAGQGKVEAEKAKAILRELLHLD